MTTIIKWIGIDPGASGGLVVQYNQGSIFAESMPDTEIDIWNWIEGQSSIHPEIMVFAIIEKVQGYIGSAQPGSAMFKFGMSYGGLRMALIAAGIPFEECPPQKWQKAMGITPRDSKRESKGEFKNRLKAKASALFPNQKITLATADAFLISEYCRRKRTGTL